MQRYEVLGLMSGTSLDGLDLAYCSFERKERGWEYQLIKTDTRAYSEPMRMALSLAHKATAESLHLLDIELGQWIGIQCRDFLSGFRTPLLIASHGHTILHQPEKGLSLQIGNAHYISKINSCPVVADFRQGDVALKGQGAPLVPVGDALLFSDYAACLNLGGFSNVSAEIDGERKAFDIGPCNIPLNELAGLLRMPYDPEGQEASKGTLIPELYKQLNAMAWYQQPPPKSLGREWYEQSFRPILSPSIEDKVCVQDLLCTLNEHMAFQIAEVLKKLLTSKSSCLVTGGGAYNNFLMKKIKDHLPAHVSLFKPAEEVISFKEALIFAFLGLLRWLELPNTLATVTGADRDTCSGVLYLP